MNDDTAVLHTLGFRGEEPPEPQEDDDEGLAGEIAKAAPKKWWNKGTVALGAAVLLAGGFVGGLQAQKHWGSTTTATSGFPGAGAGARAGYGGGYAGARGGYGGANGGGFPGGQQPGAAASAAPAAAGTTGTVKLVDGSTIYVQTADGSVVTVKTDSKTSVKTASSGKLSDVKAGQSVTIQGDTGTDGTVTASTVTATKK